ncbi:Two pore calcium channel protein 1 [Armadillidium nasatum]|uniref:Two pore calcium channel protein 1 n=1 Tax=Armadillidium nasatum TaxID=96803 RepID=A0A5N5TNA8_9CRUS|nr:Two pore calcium channel protein 1 [Armadillidium nasatum]
MPYFSSYWNSVFELYVLITTSNNPDIMMPAFDLSSWYVLFFMVFITLCFFIYMNIILAVIYNNYRKHLKNEVKKSIVSKRSQLSKAFDMVYTYRGMRKVVTKKIFYELMEALPTKRRRRDFLKLADLLNVEVMEVTHNNSFCVKNFPFIYNSKYSVHIQKAVKNIFVIFLIY